MKTGKKSKLLFTGKAGKEDPPPAFRSSSGEDGMSPRKRASGNRLAVFQRFTRALPLQMLQTCSSSAT